MKRPSLVSGLVVFTMALLFLIFKSSTLIVLCPLAVSVLLFYFSTKNEKIKNFLIIPTVTISILISCISLYINNHFVYEKAVQYENTTCDIVATVVENAQNHYIIKTKLIKSDYENIKIILYPPENTDFEIYDTIFIDNADISETESASIISEKCFISVYNSSNCEKIGEKEKDFYYYVLYLKVVCINKLSEYLYSDSFSVISGMFFGGTDYISEETIASFRNSGVAHLLAVSGLHTSLWCSLFIAIFKFFKMKEKYAKLSGIFILIVLTIISGFTPSVMRSAFMMGITLIAPVFKKHSDSINSLGLAAGIILIFNPYVLYTPSFYLSFLATAGVVSSTNFNYKINPFLEKSKLPCLIKRAIKFVYSSILISIFATIFTLPASVYYFGTVSIIAPVTNLLTVNLAFITMITTLLSLTLGFIPFEIFNESAEFLFTITDYLLKLLIATIKYIGSLKYASITTNEVFVYCGIALSILLLCAYVTALNKLTIKTHFRRIAVCFIILPIILSLVLSVIPFKANTQFTILGNTNTPNIIIRTGTHYVIINTTEYFEYNDYNYLPKANNDTIDLFAVTSLNKMKLEAIQYIKNNFNIKKTMITTFTNSTLYNFNTNVFDSAQVSSDFTYSSENQINIRIFDTYGKNCAIIEFNGKIIVLSFSEYNDLTEIKNEVGKIDVLVLPKNVPDDFSITVDTLIICSTTDNNIHKNDYIGYLYSENFYRTSTLNDITLDLGW